MNYLALFANPDNHNRLKYYESAVMTSADVAMGNIKLGVWLLDILNHRLDKPLNDGEIGSVGLVLLAKLAKEKNK